MLIHFRNVPSKFHITNVYFKCKPLQVLWIWECTNKGFSFWNLQQNIFYSLLNVGLYLAYVLEEIWRFQVLWVSKDNKQTKKLTANNKKIKLTFKKTKTYVEYVTNILESSRRFEVVIKLWDRFVSWTKIQYFVFSKKMIYQTKYFSTLIPTKRVPNWNDCCRFIV